MEHALPQTCAVHGVLADEQRGEQAVDETGGRAFAPADEAIVRGDFDERGAALVEPALGPAKGALKGAGEVEGFDGGDFHR